MTRRGDVVIVQFPYTTGGSGKKRPAVVVQDNRNNGRLQNTIVAMITGITTLAPVEPTQASLTRPRRTAIHPAYCTSLP